MKGVNRSRHFLSATRGDQGTDGEGRPLGRRVVGRSGVGMAAIHRPRRVSIFSPATEREREENFESYWVYQQRRDGEVLEDTKDLSVRRSIATTSRCAMIRGASTGGRCC